MGIFGTDLAKDNIKIMSLNCQHSQKYGNLKRFLQMVMNEYTYDVILLQEADSKIIDFFKKQDIYNITQSESSEKNHFTCIISKLSYPLGTKVESLHFSYNEKDTLFDENHVFGMVAREITILDDSFIFVSLHLPSGLDPFKRRKNLQNTLEFIKNNFKQKKVIIGGDFNLGYPFELEFTSSFVRPEYRLVTIGLPPTLDSFHTEIDTSITSYVAHFMRTLGMRIRLRADHILVSKVVSEEYDTSTSVIQFEQKGAISDHSPIVMYLYPKKSST